jgi:hypothetical protein
MSKNAPAVKDAAPLPALPGMYDRVDVADIQLPSIYLQQPLSQGVENGITKPGDGILGLGADDLDPVFLVTKDKPSFTGFILRRKKSYARSERGASMEWLNESEYQSARINNERDVWSVFQYLVAIPDVDDTVPARLMLWKTSGIKPAKKINYHIDRALAQGNPDPVCIEFSVAQATNKDGQKYFVWNPKLGTPTQDGDLEIARRMQSFGLSDPAENEAPVGDSQPGF